MKKIAFLFIFSLLLVNCGGDSNDPIVTPPIVKPPVDDGKPTAVNDVASTIEDTEVVLSNLLSNDTLTDNATITSFDSSSSNNGSIEDNRNGSYTYAPPAGYIGEDTFTYTICDDDSTPNCSTATVTITITDEGSPEANDDEVDAVKNTAITFADVLENDSLIDDTELTSVDDTNSSGSVVLNTNGTITYTPMNDFLGEDTFTYTICDDDDTCSTATVTVTVHEVIVFNIPAELASYYDGTGFADVAELVYLQLETLTQNKHTTILSYGERHQYLYNADEDESNTDNVVLMYSGESRYWEEYTTGNNSYSPQTFNTEHIYPQSLLSSENAVTDLHHLRSCDDATNSMRSNYPFTNGSGTYGLVGDNEWYPGDDWRGDVARMVMYLNIRYYETFEKVGTIDLFLEWNAADPVSSFEMQRNDIIEAAQGNRNPFIDNPYFATLIWGGSPAENKWE